MSDEQIETFGDVIQEIQGDLGQRQFARVAGDVPPGNVNDWLQSRPPKLKLLLQVAEALEEAELLSPEQRERLFRAAEYVDPRRDRSAGPGAPAVAAFSAPAPTAKASAAPNLKSYFANRQAQPAALDRLLRHYGELLKWCQTEGFAVPPLDAASLGAWEALTDERVDQYLKGLREAAAAGGKPSR